MAFEILGLDHVVLRVVDMDRMLRFYREVLGCDEERRVDAIGLVQLRAGRSLIDLIQEKVGRSQPGRNMDHFALRIEPFDEGALRADLEGHGVPVGAIESRYGADGQGPSLYIEDPEGNTVELKGPPAST